MEYTWRSATAGILDIISGVGMLFICFCLMLAGYYFYMIGGPNSSWLPTLRYSIGTLLVIVALLAIVIVALLAIIGGIFCLRRKRWGLSLAGAIAALFCCFIFGVISIILTMLAHSDFRQVSPAQPSQSYS